jgi:hypothetical protein
MKINIEASLSPIGALVVIVANVIAIGNTIIMKANLVCSCQAPHYSVVSATEPCWEPSTMAFVMGAIQ